MSIPYALVPNRMSTVSNVSRAVVQSPGTIGFEDILRLIDERGSTTTRADTLAVLEDVRDIVESFLKQGHRVRIDGFVEFFPRIGGNFTGSTDAFDPLRHRLGVGATAGSKLRKAVRAAGTEKVERTPRKPRPIAYLDLASGTWNQTLTPSTIGTLIGAELKFDPAQPDEGLFLLPSGGGPAVPVPAGRVQTNFPKKLVFLVPDAGALPPGSYRLEVRARLRFSSRLTAGWLNDALAVV